MILKLTILTAGLGCMLTGGAFALPMDTPTFGDIHKLVALICAEDGRCWDADGKPGARVAGGVIRDFEGRSGYRSGASGETPLGFRSQPWSRLGHKPRVAPPQDH
ncbi:MAG: hypothetical protein QOJ51_329 [Acidobacteriaceae bacterium]|nr:hypothetical protein [Acidobacteriaceae bacterium]